MKAIKTNIKKIVSWTIGLPCALIAISEVEDLSLWWIQFAAIGILILIFFWNGLLNKEDFKISNHLR